MDVTAKIKVIGKTATGDGAAVTFGPDYADGRNAEWAAATPSLALTMGLKGKVADQFNQGDTITLTFHKGDEN
jgi:hypothetical protein